MVQSDSPPPVGSGGKAIAPQRSCDLERHVEQRGWVVTEDQRLVKIVPRANGFSSEMSLTLFSDALAPTVGGGSIWLIVYKGTGEIWQIDPSSAAANITRRAGRYPLDLAVTDRGDSVWAVDITGSVLRVNPTIDLAVAKIRTAPPARRSSLAVGGGAVWVAVQD